MIFFLRLLFLLLLFDSCSSLSRRPIEVGVNKRIVESVPATFQNYQQLKRENKLLEAYVELKRLTDQELISEEEPSLIAAIKSYYENITKNADFREWQLWHQSLFVLGLLGKQSYWTALFDYHIRLKQYGAALAVVTAMLYEEIPEGALNDSMHSLMEEQWQQTPLSQQTLLGTVLVEVDLGLDSQRGISLPKVEIGGGFFVDKQGFILTNHHVIASNVDPGYEGYSKVFVRLGWEDGRVPARVVGWDEERDLALLKIEAEAKFVISLSFDELKSGDTVFAIGSPIGLESSITRGTLSAPSRKLLPLTDVLQIDAAVSPGSSGGPLLNEDRQIAGVVFSKAALQNVEGIAFAIPLHSVVASLPRLYGGGKLENSWLGMIVNESRNSHIEVRYVVPQSTAEKSQLQSGDRILSFNSTEVQDISELTRKISLAPEGSIFRLKVKRQEKELELYGLLEPRWEKPVEKMLNLDTSAELFHAFFGGKLELISPGNQFRILEVRADSVADNYGLARGDVLTLKWFILDEEEQLLVLATTIGKRHGQFPVRLLMGNSLDSYDIL